MATEYRITLQRDLSRTIHDPGAVSVILPLNDEQLIGLSNTVDTLVILTWHNRNFTRNLDIVRLSDNMIIGSDYLSHTLYPLGAIPFNGDIRNLYHTFIGTGRTPLQFLNQLGFPRQPTLAYWCMFQHHFRSVQTLIWAFQFETPSFLQGAITGFNWFGVNWRDHIILIHHQNQLEEIVGFA